LTEPTADSTRPEIVIRSESGSVSSCVELRLDDRGISRLWIVPFTIHIGVAKVRMDGIGGVGTDDEHRNRGYSRRVLEAAIQQMRSGDAALSMLYGIRDFYPKFGFATTGPDHLVVLTDLKRHHALPTGWTVRPFTARDLPTVQALYGRNATETVGAAVRPAEGGVWTRLLESTDASGRAGCRVLEGPDGAVHAYVWRARWCWYVNHALEPNYEDSLVLGEVMADRPLAADAALAACRLWALEEAGNRTVKQVVLALPPNGVLAAAAMRQDARFIQNYGACGGSMARVLSVPRLLEALRPELQARLQAAHNTFTGSLVLETDIGSAALQITPEHVMVAEAQDAGSDGLHVTLPQAELARLALGAFPPADLLARLAARPSEAVSQLLETLFPLRHPHMYLPDRF
jgi:predicted acetyltransferase